MARSPALASYCFSYSAHSHSGFAASGGRNWACVIPVALGELSFLQPPFPLPSFSRSELPSSRLPFSSHDGRSIFQPLANPETPRSFLIWLAEAWTVAAFGEEMYFGILIGRVSELVGKTGIGQVVAVASSSVLFGLAHRYQGWTGVIATAIIGAVLGTVYLRGRRNLWTVIVCHGIVDTVILSTLYFGHSSLLFP